MDDSYVSADCLLCLHPLLASAYVQSGGVNAWMNAGVSISRHGVMHRGAYDGLGHLGNSDQVAVGDGQSVWHEACWELSRRPTRWRGASRVSAGQGVCFHILPDPRLAAGKLPGRRSWQRMAPAAAEARDILLALVLHAGGEIDMPPENARDLATSGTYDLRLIQSGGSTRIVAIPTSSGRVRA